MKDLKVKRNGNSAEESNMNLSAAPAHALLASCYYHFGYLRLSRAESK